MLSLGTFVVAAAALMASCDGPRTINAPDRPRAFTNPWFDPPGKGHTQDLDGLPDLVVDEATMKSSWVVRQEEFTAGECSVEEGNIPTGTHRALRFSVLINNRGTADLFVGDPRKHMDPNGDGNFADQDGLFEFASCHAHFHFRNYATYELLPVGANGVYGPPVQARKRGFCMLDTTPDQGNSGEPKPSFYVLCGNLRSPGNQGISANWGDIYEKSLPGQLFLLDDVNEPVPPGRYVIRVVANPPFVEKPGEVCPVKDAAGFCHMFAELSYANNVGEIVIEIPTHVGRTGVGPGQGDFEEGLDPAHHPEAHGPGAHRN